MLGAFGLLSLLFLQGASLTHSADPLSLLQTAADCPTGTHRPSNTTLCVTCAAGTFSPPGPTRPACLRCPIGSLPGVAGQGECPCAEGWYRVTVAGVASSGVEELLPTCKRCPYGGVCRGGAVHVAPGFTRSGGDGTALRMCVPPEACLGGTGNGTCSDRYLGQDCGLCAEGHYRLLTKCEPCGRDHTAWRAAILCAFPVLLAAVFTAESLATERRNTANGRNRRAALWILLFGIQVIALVPLSLVREPPWPSPLSSALAASTAFLFNVELAAHECFSQEMGFRWRYVSGIASPIALVLCAPFTVAVALLLRKGMCSARADFAGNDLGKNERPAAGGGVAGDDLRSSSRFEPPVSGPSPPPVSATTTTTRDGYVVDTSAPFSPVTPPEGSQVHPRAHKRMRRRAMASLAAGDAGRYSFADHTCSVVASLTLFAVLPLLYHALSPLACVYHPKGKTTRLRAPTEECWGDDIDWSEAVTYMVGFIIAVLTVVALSMAVLMHGKGTSRNANTAWRRRMGQLTDFLKRRRVAWPARYAGWAFFAALSVTAVPPLHLGKRSPEPEVPQPVTAIDFSMTRSSLMVMMVTTRPGENGANNGDTIRNRDHGVRVMQSGTGGDSGEGAGAFSGDASAHAPLLRIVAVALVISVLAAGKAALRPHILRLHNRIDALAAGGAALLAAVAVIGIAVPFGWSDGLSYAAVVAACITGIAVLACLCVIFGEALFECMGRAERAKQPKNAHVYFAPGHVVLNAHEQSPDGGIEVVSIDSIHNAGGDETNGIIGAFDSGDGGGDGNGDGDTDDVPVRKFQDLDHLVRPVGHGNATRDPTERRDAPDPVVTVSPSSAASSPPPPPPPPPPPVPPRESPTAVLAVEDKGWSSGDDEQDQPRAEEVDTPSVESSVTREEGRYVDPGPISRGSPFHGAFPGEKPPVNKKPIVSIAVEPLEEPLSRQQAETEIDRLEAEVVLCSSEGRFEEASRAAVRLERERKSLARGNFR